MSGPLRGPAQSSAQDGKGHVAPGGGEHQALRPRTGPTPSPVPPRAGKHQALRQALLIDVT